LHLLLYITLTNSIIRVLRSLYMAQEKKDLLFQSDHWDTIVTDYKKTSVEKHFVSNTILFALLLVGVAIIIFFNQWIKVVGAIVALHAFSLLAQRAGHREGYFDGFRAGYDESINSLISKDDHS
jgi:hypothetical protein